MRRVKPENAIKRAREWNSCADGPQSEEEIAAEMRAFGLVTAEQCPKHPDGTSCKVTVFRNRCAEKREGGRRCETSIATLGPYISSQAKFFNASG